MSGRFLSVDPLAALAPNMTPYHYCHNNPINRIDPDGRVDGIPNTRIPDPYLSLKIGWGAAFTFVTNIVSEVSASIGLGISNFSGDITIKSETVVSEETNLPVTSDISVESSLGVENNGTIAETSGDNAGLTTSPGTEQKGQSLSVSKNSSSEATRTFSVSAKGVGASLSDNGDWSVSAGYSQNIKNNLGETVANVNATVTAGGNVVSAAKRAAKTNQNIIKEVEDRYTP